MNRMSTPNMLETFVTIANLADVPITLAELQVEVLSAPHQRPPSLPAGMFAVYVFLHGDRCLKVGKAGAKSAARYCSQHYGLNAPSTLAKSLIKNQTRLGLTSLDEFNIGNWICQNTNRINVLLPSKYGAAVLSLLESFIQCRLNPEFEGFESQRLPNGKGLVHTGDPSITVGSLFVPEPESWGLRGDPFLWRQMQSKLAVAPPPATIADFDSLIANAFLLLSGKPISTQDDFHSEAHAHGGMSSGFICPAFWRDQGIPLLRERFAAAQLVVLEYGAKARRL